MCTNECALAGGHFQRLGGLVTREQTAEPQSQQQHNPK